MEYTFSVEMVSKSYVKNLTISDEANDRVLFEGNLGELQELSIVDGDILEFTGVYGVLRVTTQRDQLQIALSRKNRVESQRRGGAL